jgi:Icc-related predicted phosphoesterase
MEDGTTRVAALGDIHLHEGLREEWNALLEDIEAHADVLVLCGDLTNRGLPREAHVLVDSLAPRRLPVVGILGNHDVEEGHAEEIVQILCDAGVLMLDDEPREIGNVGFAGVKGFAGGFDEHALAPFGERLIKQFVHEAVDDALRLESGLSRLRTPHRIAVLHYAPIRGTVEGEPLEIFPFLGSSRLADPLAHFDLTAVIHGHAHHGKHEGKTLRGTPVYNVAHPLMKQVSPQQPYLVLRLPAT